ncbi:MAG: 23S rRNA (adenine(2030)-N(6))-methyltransferase RlmJ [Magnetospirillum sp.]|nr:23S rRNA (adenine(2030)-N(6))-methyltransferase RlmJ [Magnetospirillum sp.]
MNYRHAFHAGNFADVVKHAVLALVLDHLARKAAPFFVLDTHAGTGLYDLAGLPAGKTGEWREGIGRILAKPSPPAALSPYLDAVRAANPAGELRWYPGSPALAQALTRPQDRIALVELHPEDGDDLKRRFSRDRRVGVHRMDGYAALKGLLPPPERRGLALIDPPFEVRDETARLCKALAQACRRWSTGIYLVWYPIKARPAIDRLHADLAMLGLPPTLAAEVLVRSDDDPSRLNGSGLAVVNPPWTLDATLAELLPWLAEALAAPEGGTGAGHRLEWLVGENA